MTRHLSRAQFDVLRALVYKEPLPELGPWGYFVLRARGLVREGKPTELGLDAMHEIHLDSMYPGFPRKWRLR